VDTNRAWEIFRENIMASATDSVYYCERKQN
jgi:hypothetical protein